METGGQMVPIALGGMDTRLRPAPASASLIENMRYNPGDATWSTMTGTLPIAAISTVGVGLFWFQPRPNERYLVVERRISANTNRVAWYNFQTGTMTTIADRRRVEVDDGTAEQFVEHGRWLYMTSGFNSLVRWNGRRTVPVGFDRPAPAVQAWGPDQGLSSAISGSYDVATGTYLTAFNNKTQRGLGSRPIAADGEDARLWKHGYGITLLNELAQESPMGPVVWASGEGNITLGHTLARLRFPQMAGHIRGVRLWRTINVAGVQTLTGLPMYLHSEWPTAHGFDLIDHKPDAELVTQWDPDQVGATPQSARAFAIWRGAFWLGGMPDEPAVLRWSHPLFHEQFPEVNQLRVGSARSGSIIAIRPVPRGLVVLMQHGLYLVKGNFDEGFRVESIDETRGTTAPRAVEYVPGVGLFYLQTSGPQLMVGTADDDQPISVQSVGDTVAAYWSRQIGTSIAASVSVFDPERREVWFQIPHQGDNLPTLGLVLHLGSGFWSVRKGFQVSGFAYYKGAVYASSWSKTNIYKFTGGSRAYGAGINGDITSAYLTNPLLLEDPATSQRVTLLVRAVGSADTVEVSTRADGAQLWTVQTGETLGVGWRPQLHQMRVAPEWGTAVWSATEYYDDNVWTRVPVSLRVPSYRALELKVRSSTRLTLGEIDLLQKPIPGPQPLERK